MNALRLSALLVATATALFAAEPVLIDFGSAANRTESVAGGPAWNNVDEKAQRNLTDLALVNAAGAPSGILLSVVSPFGGANSSGVKAAAGAYPESAVSDSLYANIEAFGKNENLKPVLRLAGLKPGAKYECVFFASRMAGDNRTARYTVSGAATVFAELNAANNKSETAAAPAISPAADGTLTITITPAEANNNANHFTYLGVLEIREI